ncbi:MAG: Nucleoid occlusion protein [Anaerolineae bacterium]|nr:Nucleoid occlusion protein [Anaerolineae bacterium]
MQTTEISVKLTDLRPGPYQSRRDFDPAALLELAESIHQSGIINPPLVAKNGRGYVLLAGERRWRASCALAAAREGVFPDLNEAVMWVAEADDPQLIVNQPELADTQITVRLASGDEADLHVAAIIDNHQRANLNPIEEAQDFQNLKERYGWSNWQVAQAVGRSDVHVRARLRLLDLDEEIRELIATKKLSKDLQVAEALLAVPDRAARLKLARRFAERNSSIKAIVAGCRRVVELMELARQNQVTPTVVLPAVRIERPMPPTSPPVLAPGVCLCDDCREQINNLAEELCGKCGAQGLTAECLTCPGVIEFVEKLIRAAQC